MVSNSAKAYLKARFIAGTSAIQMYLRCGLPRAVIANQFYDCLGGEFATV